VLTGENANENVRTEICSTLVETVQEFGEKLMWKK